MTRSRSTSLRSVALCIGMALLALGTSTTAAADNHEADDARIKYRQSIMSTIGTNMGAIGDIMKNQLALPGAIENHAGQMADAAALIAPAFEKNLSEGRTDAKAEIWQDWAKFENAITKYEEAARGLATAASGNDPSAVRPAMRALGKSCGGCHKPFRKAKEDSFKNN